jgi:hypothetical protein
VVGRRVVEAVGLVLVSSLVVFAVAEGLVRLAGHRPRRHIVIRPEQTPDPMHRPDPVLGWRLKAGHYRLGPYAPGAAPIDVTIRADGTRVTGTAPPGGRPKLVLVGCSFTMGWAVTDQETWAWRLQTLRPDLEIVNHGVGGYGTLQSLMVMEELFAEPASSRPAHVLYGFIDHRGRNVASSPWLFALSLNTHSAATPYATLTPDDQLVRHPPEAYPSLPFHEYLASVALLESSWVQWHAGPRLAGSGRVTRRLVQEMAERSRAAGVGFSVVVLNVPKALAAVYLAYGRQASIDVIDCNQPRYQPVQGDAHPNAATHERWAECVASALADRRLPVHGATGR